MSSKTIPDKTLSEIIYQPYETTRRQDKLRNGARLRHQFFKDFHENELRKRMQDTIDRHGFILYNERDFETIVEDALKQREEFTDYVFSMSVDAIVNVIKKFNMKEDSVKTMKSHFTEKIRKSVDIYAYNQATNHICFFNIMNSRQSAANIKSILFAYDQVDISQTFYILSFEKIVPKVYTDLGAKVILVSELLDIDVDKLVIV